MSQQEVLRKTISGTIISDLIHEKKLSQADVAKDLKESEQVISNYAKGKRFISADFANKWEKKYGEKLMDLIDHALIKSTDVDTNITPAQKPSDNKEKMENQEEVYRNLVEGNTEYILIPRSVLQEKYRLVALEQFQKDKEQMDKDKAVIDRLLSMNEALIAEVTSLKTKVPEVQKA